MLIKIEFTMTGLKTISKKKFNYLFFLLIILLVCSSKEEIEQEPIYTVINHAVKKGEHLEGILDDLLSRQLSTSVISVLEKAQFPFRKCIPGDSIEILKENGTFLKLTYSQNHAREYYVLNNEQHLSVAMKLPYIDTSACFLKGEVTFTLYEAVMELGEKPNLVYRYADVFAWEIDFVTETRVGDSFYIFFDKTFCDSKFVEYLNLHVAHYKGDVGDYYGIYYSDPDGREDYYNLKGQSLRKSLLKSPLRFSYISSYFSKRRYHPILKVWRPHHGLDYAAPVGTPVSSIGDGTVTYKGWKGGYGNVIEIRHKNNFKTRYGHLSKFAKGIRKGKKVKMGQLIGYVGSTGLSTGPHLHFELHKNGRPINPLRVKIPRAPSVKKTYMSNFEAHRDSLLRAVEEFLEDRGEKLSSS